jgi:sporulation protein YlmC with PRC-barrel domain
MRLELGRSIGCADGTFGRLADVVIDPTAKRVTHVVAEPKAKGVIGNRLVPVDLIDVQASDDTIRLRCTIDEAARLETAEDVAYLSLGESPVSDPNWDVGASRVLASPFYEGTGFGDYPGDLAGADSLFYDRVPKGELEIRRSSAVYSSDGHHLGHVDGFVVDENGQVAQLVLERGHLWGRREVTIPIGAVEQVSSDEVRLSLSRDNVGALPAVRVHR